MTKRYLAIHQPSGERYALRENDQGKITGVCGPLTDAEIAECWFGDDFEYQTEDVEWAEAQGFAHVRDL